MTILPLLLQTFGASVDGSNAVVKALLGTTGSPGLIPIAYTCCNGAVMLRCLSEGYNWIIRGDFAYLRNVIVIASGGLMLQHAPAIISLATGIFIPTLF